MKTISAFGNRLRERTEHLTQNFPVGERLSEELRKELDRELDALIGHTRLEFIPVGPGGIFLKKETENPSETHYDRAFPKLIRLLEAKDKIIPGVTKELIETSSGSAGPSFGWIARAYGYHSKVLIPQGLPAARVNAHAESVDEVIISAYPGYLEGMIRTLKELTEEDDMRGKLLRKETVLLNHSRRKETPAAFRTIAQEVIAQLPENVKLDAFVCAIGNGTTIAGIGGALREKFQNIVLHGYEETSGGLFGATGAQGVEMPFVKRGALDRITVLEKDDYAGAVEAYNTGKTETETLGRTTVSGLLLAEKMILHREALFALVIAYDNLGRYDTIVKEANSIYRGEGMWDSK